MSSNCRSGRDSSRRWQRKKTSIQYPGFEEKGNPARDIYKCVEGHNLKKTIRMTYMQYIPAWQRHGF